MCRNVLTGSRKVHATAILRSGGRLHPPVLVSGSEMDAIDLAIDGGQAVKALPIPSNPSLAGAFADVHWIAGEPGIAPCAPVPDVGATSVLRLVLN